MGNPNSKKHKANHAGYRDKPGRRAIDALCGMYAAIGNVEMGYKSKHEKANFYINKGRTISNIYDIDKNICYPINKNDLL